jgi:signal transduction histidine kinase
MTSFRWFLSKKWLFLLPTLLLAPSQSFGTEVIDLRDNLLIDNMLLKMAPVPASILTTDGLWGLKSESKLADYTPLKNNADIKNGSWFYTVIHNTSELPAAWYLTTQINGPGKFSAFIVGENDDVTKIMEADFPATNKDLVVTQGPVIVSDKLVFKFGEKKALWIHIEESVFAELYPFRFVSERTLLDEKLERAIRHNFYWGTYFALFTFFIVFSFVLKTRNILIYGLLFSTAVYLNFHSYGSLSMAFPAYGNIHFAIFPMIFMTLSLLHTLFALSFLNLRETLPKTYRLFVIFMSVAVTIYIIGFLFPSGLMNTVRVFALYGLFVMGLGLAIRVVISKTPGSTFFGLGFGVFLYWALGNLAGHTYMSADDGVLLDTKTIYGQIVEALIFGGAIVRQSWSLRHQRDASLKAELAVTKKKVALEKELHEASKDLQKIQNDYKTIATTRHDLRQPLTSLRLAVEHTGNTELAKKLHAGLDYITAVLDPTFRKKEAVHAEKASQQETIPLQLVFDNLARIYGDEAKAKGLKLKFSPTSFQTKTDIITLIRMLSNLLSNAIKYTENGGILVGARRQGCHLRVEVWDTGSGLSPCDIQRLLKPYERGTTDNQAIGEGLGLAIVTENAKQLGLELSVASKLGKGSVFAVCNLPKV